MTLKRVIIVPVVFDDGCLCQHITDSDMLDTEVGQLDSAPVLHIAGTVVILERRES